MMSHSGASHPDWVRSAVERYSAPLTRYAFVITGDLEHARDVAQETLIRLCQEDRARVETHVAEWLFTVCRNRAVDLLRKDHRMKPLDEAQLDARPSPARSPAAEAAHRDLSGRVLAMLATLPCHQQEVVRLKFQNGLSYQEISRITRLTVGNVGFLIHTALKTLRRQMEAEALVIQPLPSSALGTASPARRTP